MKKKVAVKKVKKARSKKIGVKYDIIKEAQSEGPVAETILEPVNLAATLPTHTPGLERC